MKGGVPTRKHPVHSRPRWPRRRSNPHNRQSTRQPARGFFLGGFRTPAFISRAISS